MTGAVPDALARAAAGLALPPGGVLRLVAVGAADAADLPAALHAAAPRRRNTFAAGRLAAAAALEGAGMPGRPPGIGADGLPVWPRDWLGSISHTDDIAAAVVAPRTAGAEILGIDLEALMSPEVAGEVAAQIMPEAVPGAAGMAAELELTRAFSAKEALFKALYPLTRQFREFTAARIDWPGGGVARLTLTEDWGPSWPAGTLLEAHQAIAAGHVLSVVWR